MSRGNYKILDAFAAFAGTGDVAALIEFVWTSHEVPDELRARITAGLRALEVRRLSPKQIEKAAARVHRQARRDDLIREIRAADDRLIAEGVSPAEVRAARLEEMFPVAGRHAVSLGRDMLNIIGKSEADLIPPRSDFHRRRFGEARGLQMVEGREGAVGRNKAR